MFPLTVQAPQPDASGLCSTAAYVTSAAGRPSVSAPRTAHSAYRLGDYRTSPSANLRARLTTDFTAVISHCGPRQQRRVCLNFHVSQPSGVLEAVGGNAGRKVIVDVDG